MVVWGWGLPGAEVGRRVGRSSDVGGVRGAGGVRGQLKPGPAPPAQLRRGRVGANLYQPAAAASVNTGRRLHLPDLGMEE